MRTTLTTLVLLAILVLTGGVILHSQNTPQSAIARIGEAIETRDPQLLDRHVDLEAVINAAVDDLLARAVADGRARGDTAEGGFAERARAELAAAVRDVVLTAFFSGTMPGRQEIEIEALSSDYARAHATVQVAATRPDTVFMLDLALEKRAAGWTLVEIVELADYVRTVDGLRAQLLRR